MAWTAKGSSSPRKRMSDQIDEDDDGSELAPEKKREGKDKEDAEARRRGNKEKEGRKGPGHAAEDDGEHDDDDDEDEDEEDGDEGQAHGGKKNKKQKAGDATKKVAAASTNASEPTFELSSKRRVTVRKFKSTVLVDIREFYEASGTLLPGRKGISLTQEQWASLTRQASAIDAAIAKLK